MYYKLLAPLHLADITPVNLVMFVVIGKYRARNRRRPSVRNLFRSFQGPKSSLVDSTHQSMFYFIKCTSFIVYSWISISIEIFFCVCVILRINQRAPVHRSTTRTTKAKTWRNESCKPKFCCVHSRHWEKPGPRVWRHRVRTFKMRHTESRKNRNIHLNR